VRAALIRPGQIARQHLPMRPIGLPFATLFRSATKVLSILARGFESRFRPLRFENRGCGRRWDGPRRSTKDLRSVGAHRIRSLRRCGAHVPSNRPTQ
jgi:hypothetical protein